MRIPDSAHQSCPWRLHEIAPDFRLEDAWALPAEGRAADFQALLDVIDSLDPSRGGSRATRLLFGIRRRIGSWLGWDDTATRLPIPGDADTSLLARLPEDLRGTVADRAPDRGPFTPLYRTHDEWAAELTNRTVHAVMHLGWVQQQNGRYRGQMGIYVKPRGSFGGAYMAAIAPFRHRVVYPALMRQIEQAWSERA